MGQRTFCEKQFYDMLRSVRPARRRGGSGCGGRATPPALSRTSHMQLGRRPARSRARLPACPSGESV
mgnify:CR=1 FL=1